MSWADKALRKNRLEKQGAFGRKNRAKQAFEIKESLSSISLSKAFDRAKREKENPGPVCARPDKTKQIYTA